MPDLTLAPPARARGRSERPDVTVAMALYSYKAIDGTGKSAKGLQDAANLMNTYLSGADAAMNANDPTAAQMSVVGSYSSTVDSGPGP